MRPIDETASRLWRRIGARGPLLRAAIAALCAAGVGTGSAPARACGVAPSGRAPSLALERTLIIHDADKQREHFIRELAFRDADASFGFIVPTPSRPELAKVEGRPLAALPLEFPAAPPVSLGFGSDGGRVRVLQHAKLGRFTGVVLAANDGAALARWLRTNRFVESAPLAAWLAHYVRLGFHFVALRYDPPIGVKKAASATGSGGGPDGVQTETIRISFDTPLPYYPYFEPRGQGARASRRAMQLWLVSTAEAVPVSLLHGGSEGERWVRPLATLWSQTDALGMEPAAARSREGGGIGTGSLGSLGALQSNRDKLDLALDDALEALLPSAALTVQVFEDQKTDRTGFGDIVFTPVRATRLDAAQRGRAAPLLRLLHPATYAPAREELPSPRFDQKPQSSSSPLPTTHAE